MFKAIARDRHLNYISSDHAGKSGTNRTTQAEISNLLRHSFPGRVNKRRSHIFNGLISGGQISSMYQRRSCTGMNLKAFQDTATRVRFPLQELFTSTLPGGYRVLPVNQDKQGQYWLLSYVQLEGTSDVLPAALEDFRTMRLPLFCVQTETARLRSAQDVTSFFEEDDVFFEKLIAADESNRLDEIRAILGRHLLTSRLSIVALMEWVTS